MAVVLKFLRVFFPEVLRVRDALDEFTSIELEEPLFVIAQDLDVLLQDVPEGLD